MMAFIKLKYAVTFKKLFNLLYQYKYFIKYNKNMV